MRGFLLLCMCVLAVSALETRSKHTSDKDEEKSGRHIPPQVTDRPVIGILTLPMESFFPKNVTGTSYIAGSYVNWVEQGGARVVPLRVDQDWAELESLVRNLNGVLFTGGGALMYVPGSDPAQLSSYEKTGCFIYNLIKQIHDQGTYYPMWGTCLGFELLHQCVYSNTTTLQNFDGEPPYTQRNRFTHKASHSRLFSSKFGHYMTKLMSAANIQFLSHKHGIAPWEYKSFRNLSDTYNVLATMQDRSGNSFVSIIEAWDYPITGTQFHPEKNIYEWDVTAPIPHGPEATLMATFLADYFVSEARRNPNQFPSEAELQPWLIYNWSPFFLNSYFTQVFTFA